MKLQTKITGGPGGDCTYNYKVLFPKDRSVKDLVQDLIDNHFDRCGDIEITKGGFFDGEKVYSFGYCGQKETIYDKDTIAKYEDKKVYRISGNGGWGMMSYIIWVR